MGNLVMTLFLRNIISTLQYLLQIVIKLRYFFIKKWYRFFLTKVPPLVDNFWFYTKFLLLSFSQRSSFLWKEIFAMFVFINSQFFRVFTLQFLHQVIYWNLVLLKTTNKMGYCVYEKPSVCLLLRVSLDVLLILSFVCYFYHLYLFERNVLNSKIPCWKELEFDSHNPTLGLCNTMITEDLLIRCAFPDLFTEICEICFGGPISA